MSFLLGMLGCGDRAVQGAVNFGAWFAMFITDKHHYS